MTTVTLQRIKLATVLETSFGAWKGREHPELRKGTEAFVRGLRTNTRSKRKKCSQRV